MPAAAASAEAALVAGGILVVELERAERALDELEAVARPLDRTRSLAGAASSARVDAERA